MSIAIPYKTKQFLIVVVKCSILVGACYYIYNKLLNNDQLKFSDFISFLNENKTFSIKNICFLLTLTILNWLFEILKWKTLVNTFKRITFKDAFEQSLGGHTASLITPNRVGDYGAKALYFKKDDRQKVVLLNLLGNMAQMTATVVFGYIGLLCFYSRYQLEINAKKFMSIILIILIFGCLFFYGIKKTKVYIKGFSLEIISAFFKNIERKTYLKVLALSVIKYAVFSFQYYILLKLFGATISYTEAMVVISSMYLLASIIPALVALDVVIKTSVAVFLFGFLGIDELTILSISTLMWLLNFILPSLFGSYYILNFKLPKHNIE